MREGTGVATRIGLAEQDGGSQSGSGHHLLYCGNWCLRAEPRVATRIGLAQQDGGANVDAETIGYGAAISACEKTRWQLALRWLSRMAEAKGEADTIGYQCGDGVSHTVPIYERTEAHRRISLEQSWSRLRVQRKW